MSVLFEKTTIKGLEVKNRLVRSATHEGMGDESGFPGDNLFRLYERLAMGGVGLIITGHSVVSQDGKIDDALCIDRDAHVPRYRELVATVHQHGSKIAMQINHCGKQTTKDMTGTQTIAPSATKDESLLDMPREMTAQDIERVIDDFGKASKRVKDSHFDAVQIHGAHGYLIS